MKNRILFLLLAFLFLPKINLACTCFGRSTFCEDVFDDNGDVHSGYFIVRAKVISENDATFSKDVRVISPIHGDFNTSEFTIGTTSCGGPWDLELGKEYILAVSQWEDIFFMDSDCIVSSLEIENETVKGKIAPGIESINYFDLNTLEVCGNSFSNIFSLENLNIFPNPTLGEIEISTGETNNSIENIHFEIYDIVGRKLTNLRRLDGILEDETLKMNLENLSAGVYFIRFSSSAQKFTHRVVKL